MINELSDKSPQEILDKIVDIHRSCVYNANAKTYTPEEIKEWTSTITTENVKKQLNNSIWITLEEENSIVGFAQYSLKNKTIYQIHVDNQYQGKGYGSKLMEYMENDFVKNNLKEIHLYSTLNSVSYYEKKGFKIVKGIKWDVGDWDIEMADMVKDL